ncbi:hypothetical protein LBW60_01520 [Ralstonia solanacearum]|uniref:hypothetical protein n=1 Tax=Ralstonia solanacearum TaxID=305 RepID=UPI002305E684|nr:hypothetical protein [Ralstonia solanacearum]MDB0507748.1 hypothetical protein [Ralstonia solanacearum]MDB0512018.1 hypothetical protein [Ralstonia solanacearum]
MGCILPTRKFENIQSTEPTSNMSFSLTTYMRTDSHGLDLRVMQRLQAGGYKIEFQPGSSLGSTPADEVLWLAVLSTPQELPRIEPSRPFLAGFGYSVAQRTDEHLRYAPRGVRKFSASASTRTDAHAPLGARCIQHLIAAAIVAETDGWLLVDGEQSPRRGDNAFEMACQEMTALRVGDIKLDHGTRRFLGWTKDGAPDLNGEIIFREDMCPLPFPVPTKKWWQFWR